MSVTSADALDVRSELARPLKAADYHKLARAISSGGLSGLSELRVAILSSFTSLFLRPYLIVESARRGFSTELHFGAFGQFEQEINDPSSALWAFRPDIAVIAMRAEDVDLEAVERYYASGGERFQALGHSMLSRLLQCAEAARGRLSGPVLIANFAAPAVGPMGLFDGSAPGSLTHAVAELNRRLAAAVAKVPGAFIWDYAGLVHERGSQFFDARLWALARAPIAQEHQAATASHLMRTAAATLRPPAKCLVLDLDNTLWGGVIGDDGPTGIQLGDDYPGSAYKQLQRAALALMDRGILLAVCSKNNPDIVEQTLRTHPEMLLRWDDFACVKANWRSKSENLRAIAKELNIGVDALVLFDDNPVERAEVRAALPEVGVVEVPTDPTAYASALRACEFFDQTSLQAEDRERAAMYRRDRERRSLEKSAVSPEEFLLDLEMEGEVGVVDDGTLARIAQLVGKTNQFNLTTRRHSQADIAAMRQDADHVVAWLRLRDRFGDQGLIAVGILRRRDSTAEIDTFLMSCRVMNRRVERAFMAYLIEHARALGCTRVTGTYAPTEKNSMVSEFYSDQGFSEALPAPRGVRTYLLDLTTATIEWPDVIRRRDAAAATAGPQS